MIRTTFHLLHILHCIFHRNPIQRNLLKVVHKTDIYISRTIHSILTKNVAIFEYGSTDNFVVYITNI